MLRSLWLAKAADHAIGGKAVLVGGAAVNLHTGSYRPTDVDLCALLTSGDRRSLVKAGFIRLQGDHFRYAFDDGEVWIVEFPDTDVDGQVTAIELGSQESLAVITRESLIVDRVLQATDTTRVTFEEAVRLSVAVYEVADWCWVEEELRRRHEAEPELGLIDTYTRIKGATEAIIQGVAD